MDRCICGTIAQIKRKDIWYCSDCYMKEYDFETFIYYVMANSIPMRITEKIKLPSGKVIRNIYKPYVIM